MDFDGRLRLGSAEPLAVRVSILVCEQDCDVRLDHYIDLVSLCSPAGDKPFIDDVGPTLLLDERSFSGLSLVLQPNVPICATMFMSAASFHDLVQHVAARQLA